MPVETNTCQLLWRTLPLGAPRIPSRALTRHPAAQVSSLQESPITVNIWPSKKNSYKNPKYAYKNLKKKKLTRIPHHGEYLAV